MGGVEEPRPGPGRRMVAPAAGGSVWMSESFVAIGSQLSRDPRGSRRVISTQTEPSKRPLLVCALLLVILALLGGMGFIWRDRNAWRERAMVLERARALGPMPASPRQAHGGPSTRFYSEPPVLPPNAHQQNNASEGCSRDNEDIIYTQSESDDDYYIVDSCIVSIKAGDCVKRLFQDPVGSVLSMVQASCSFF